MQTTHKIPKNNLRPKRQMEILAPAGDEEMLRAAVFSGATCVYLGIEGFNARRGAKNFNKANLANAVAFCHARNCKVYAALNTIVLAGREDEFLQSLQIVIAAGCDAVIVQDLSAAKFIKTHAPHLPLHGSTQMSVHSLAGVLQVAELGFSRAILARELSEKEIAEIAMQSPIELEVFVHGALCTSVSGQCLMSAFFGGRSANRGACAGPCRLPFKAQRPASCTLNNEQKHPRAKDEYALSLKDLSILTALPRLEKMGVVSAKIEGRLRGPEYCAVVVDCARKALNKQQYDKELLQDVFCRSGFTDEWFTGKNSAAMFGVRTEENTQASKKALPKARELYRREMPRVPLSLHLHCSEKANSFTVVCENAEITLPISSTVLLASQKDCTDAVTQALCKTGGTPFYVSKVEVDISGRFFSAQQAGILRRKALEMMLNAREQLPAEKPEINAKEIPFKIAVKLPARPKTPKSKPALRIRLENAGQLSTKALQLCKEAIVPLSEADKIPREMRDKCWLWLPRVLFGKREKAVQAQIERTKTMGFLGYEVENIAHFQLCKGLAQIGGFGLNITNAISAKAAAELGCKSVTLSPELSSAQMRKIAQAQDVQNSIYTDALCYGHLPLMITRACPLKNANSLPCEVFSPPQVIKINACEADGLSHNAKSELNPCKNCPKQGGLIDRKGALIPVLCRDGARTLYNPVPLWMAERLEEFYTDTASLYFTLESEKEVLEIIRAFAAGKPAKGNFTRGLYDKGTI